MGMDMNGARRSWPPHPGPACTLSLRVFVKHLEAIGEIRPVERIAADTDAHRLPEPLRETGRQNDDSTMHKWWCESLRRRGLGRKVVEKLKRVMEKRVGQIGLG